MILLIAEFQDLISLLHNPECLYLVPAYDPENIDPGRATLYRYFMGTAFPKFTCEDPLALHGININP